MVYGNINTKSQKQSTSQGKLLIDVMVHPGVVELNQQRQLARPRRRRRVDYAKKIMNDEFIMNV